jgi:hypothetical protein
MWGFTAPRQQRKRGQHLRIGRAARRAFGRHSGGGGAPARSTQSTAGARRFARWAQALLVVVSLAPRLWLRGDPHASAWRRGASRRRGRGELRLRSAMSQLLHQAPGVSDHFAPRLQRPLAGEFAKVS